MVFGTTQGPTIPSSGTAKEVVKDGGRRLWKWASYPWTWGAAHTATILDDGPVGQQLRNLDGRAQVHGAAIEIMSAQVSDIVRDQEKILSLLNRQSDMFQQLVADMRNQLAESRSVPKDLASARAELADGIKRVQQTLAEETASLRSRLAPLPSTEQVRAMLGDGTVAQELASTRTHLAGEIGKIHSALSEQTTSVRERLAQMPSAEHVQTLIGGGMVVDELATARLELTDEIQKVRKALAETAASLHDRLTALPSAEQVHALVGKTVAQEAAAARAQSADDAQKVRDAVAQATSGVHDRIATLPSAQQVHTLVGGTMTRELETARAQIADDIKKLHEALAQETAGVRQLLAALPSKDQVQALVGTGPVTQQLANTHNHLSDGLQKVHQVLLEKTSTLHDRLATLPSTEQIHAFVEGGTATNVQTARRLLADEAQRGQAVADRMTRKLEFLQSRNVIPLPQHGLVMCRNLLGFLAVPADDLATIGSLADGVLPDQGTLKVVEKYLRPGGTFVDVGANVGLFSLLAARIVGPTGKVIAIEPAPATAAALRATISANGIEDIVAVKELAAGAEQGLSTLAVSHNSTKSSLIPFDTAANTTVASVAPLDTILGGLVPDMVKIDVEGWEPQVVEGMKAILRANPDIILIMDFEPAHIRSTGLSAAGWVDRLFAAGLQIFEIDERSGELTPLRTRGLEEIVSLNVVIARNDPSRRNVESATEGWLRLGSGAPALPS